MSVRVPKRRKATPGSSPGQTVFDTIVSPEFIESVPDALVAVDEAGKIVQVNSQTEAMFGYSKAELIGNGIEMLVPSRYRQRHEKHRESFVGQPKIRRMGAGLDLYGTRRDGSEFPVEISLSPVPSDQGMLVLSAIRDITDRKNIENELRAAHEELSRRTSQQLSEYRNQLASIVDSSEDAIIGKTLDGIITAWNKGAEHIYGYTAEEMLGKPISKIVPPDRPDEIPRILEKIKRGQRIEHYESVRVTKDGRHLNISLSISPIREHTGKIVGASVIARDITDQKRAEEQFRQAQKMEAVGRLAGGVAHDFNNILGIITACTELLRSRLPATTPPAYLENITKAAERGATLTRQLLAFSRKQVVQPTVLNLNERLKEVVKLLRPLMGDDVEIVLNAKSQPAFLEADSGQLDQIVLNLAVNARDAMPRGGKLILESSVVEFDESLAQQHPPLTHGQYVCLAVSDTGTGMDEATRSRIFEPFFTTKEVGKGTGLGLSTVYGIVQQAGGHIWVYSEPGRGTTFRLYFPSVAHKIGEVSAVETEPVVPAAHGTTILLVEDDEMMRVLTRQMLEEHGYLVLEAEGGQAALDLLGSNHPGIDLMITDVVMRGMSGPQLVAKMHEAHPQIRVVYTSGYTGELISQSDVLQPWIQLLEKPYTRAALLKTIHRALE